MMNNGFIFLIVCWLLFMLTLTQWLDFLWKGSKDLPSQRKKMMVLLLLLISLQGFYIPLFPNASLNAGVNLVLLGLFLYHYWKDQAVYRLQVLAVVLFLAIFYAVAYELFVLDPILMVVSPLWMLPAFLSLFIAFTTKDLALQWLMMTGGLVVGEMIHKAFLLSRVHYVYIGDAAFRDQFVIGLLFMTALHFLISLCIKGAQFMLRTFRLKQPDGKQEG